LNSAPCYERGLVNGFIRLAGGIMLRRFFRTLVCGLILMETIQAQEVIVAREKKPEPVRQTPEPEQTVQPSEQIPLETPTPTPAPRKSRSREKKSAPATLTLEQMRAAGARAAEGSNEQSVPQSIKRREPDAQSVPAQNPTVAEMSRPVKRQKSIEPANTPRPSEPRGTKLEGIGPVRPTMIESGREPPSPSPSGR
jgi:cytoskeletal protein RodZ